MVNEADSKAFPRGMMCAIQQCLLVQSCQILSSFGNVIQNYYGQDCVQQCHAAVECNCGAENYVTCRISNEGKVMVSLKSIHINSVSNSGGEETSDASKNQISKI